MKPNKSLFETRKKSVAHYRQQIQDLEKTRDEVGKVLSELVDSLVEFFPFTMGDIIIRDNLIIKVKTVPKVRYDCWEVSYEVPDGSLGRWKSNAYCTAIRFDDIGEWKKIN